MGNDPGQVDLKASTANSRQMGAFESVARPKCTRFGTITLDLGCAMPYAAENGPSQMENLKSDNDPHSAGFNVGGEVLGQTMPNAIGVVSGLMSVLDSNSNLK